VKLTGAIKGTGETQIYTTTASSNFNFKTLDNPVTCRLLKFGSNSATGTFNGKFGASVITADTVLGSTYNSGTILDSLQTSVWNVSGLWTNGSNHTIIPGTSVVRYTGTGSATWTLAGKRFYDFRIVGSAAAKLTLADSLQCAYYYDSSGKFTQSTFAIYADSTYVNVSPDSATMGANIYLKKSYYRNTAAVYRTAGGLVFDTSKSCTFNSSGYGVGPVSAKWLTVQDTGRMQKLTLNGDSCVL